MSNPTIPAAMPESPSCRRHLDPFAPELGGEIDVIANDPFTPELGGEIRAESGQEHLVVIYWDAG